jgi:biotin synthase
MSEPIPLQITVCMGSSCFSRGNDGRVIETLRQCASAAGRIPEISGHLCEDQCTCGPHITIEGTLYSNVQPSCIPELLKHHLAHGKEEHDG